MDTVARPVGLERSDRAGAYRRAERDGDVAGMAEAVLGGVWVHEHRTAAAGALLRSRLRQTLARVDPAGELGLRLRVRRAAELDHVAGTHVRVLAMLAQVRSVGSPDAHAEALNLAIQCLLGPDDAAVRRGLAEELIAQSFQTARPGDLAMGLLWQCVDLVLAGDAHAGRRLNELRDLLDIEDHPTARYVLSAVEVMLAIRAGRLGEAEALARACAGRGDAIGDVHTAGWHGGQLVAIRWYQGRLPELLPLLERMAHSPTLSATDHSYLAALAMAAALAGDRGAATGALATLCGRDLDRLPRSSTWLATMHGVAEAAYLLGDADLAARVYRLLRPHADLPVVAGPGVACFGSVRHALGVAALTTGQLDLAVEQLAAAIEDDLAIGHRPAALLSRLRYARALELRGGPGDVAVAQRERAVAGTEGEALGLGLAGCDTAAGTGGGAACVRWGRRWRVTRGERTVLVGHVVGMLHLSVLLANPGHEVPAAELASGADALGRAARTGSTQPVLDRDAITQYRRRLTALRTEAERLESTGDHDGAGRVRAERDWLVAELSRAAGLGGRTRRFADDAERARLAVGKAIRRAIDAVERLDPVLGAHLRDSVHTGQRCVYRPA